MFEVFRKGYVVKKSLFFVNSFYLSLIMLHNAHARFIFLICHRCLCFSPRPLLFFLLLCTNPVICLNEEKICFCKIWANSSFIFRLRIESFDRLLVSLKQQVPRTVAIIVTVNSHRISSRPWNNGDSRYWSDVIILFLGRMPNNHISFYALDCKYIISISKLMQAF